MAPKTPREGRSLSLPNPLRLSSVPLIGSLAFRKRPSPAPPEEPHSVSYSAADVQIPGDLTTPSVSAIPPGDTAPSSNVADDTSTQPEATNSTQPPSEVNPPKILSHLVKPDDDKASRDAAILLQRRARFNLKFRAKQVGGSIINAGKAGFSGAISGASTGIMMAGEFASLPVHAAGATKRGMVGMTHSMVARKLERFYDRTLKPAITEPQDYPWWVRQFIHDFADHMWRNLSVELLTIFETKEEDEGTDEVSIQTDRKSSHKSSSSRSAAAPPSAASLSSRQVETLYPLVRKTDECQSSTANDSVCQSGSFASDSAPSPPASPPEVSKTTPVNAAANKIASSFRLHKRRRLQKSLTGSTTLEEPAADYWIDANGGVDSDGFAASFMARSWRRFTRWLQLDTTRVLIKVELRTVKGLFRGQESDDALRESLLCGTASARVQVGPHFDRSRRVKLEPGVEPVWNQCFPEPHARRPISMDELCAHPLCVEIFHDDYSLGKATVPAAQLRSLCIGDWPGNAGKASKLLGLGEEMAQFADGPGRSDVREFEEPLSTWGTAVLHVHMRRRERPNWLHWMRLICDNWPLSMLIEAYHDAITVLPRVWQFLRAFNMMALADRVRDEQTLVTLQVTILRAQNLLNTDISSILGMHVAGASDPYCIVHCGGQQEKTETIQDNLNPIWDETFEFTMSEFELINEGLSFEIFDEDSFTVDDPLGIAFIDKQTLQRLIHEGPREDGLVEEFGPLSLQLEERPVQGSVWVRVGVVSLDRPPTMLSRRLWEAMVKPLLMKVRSFILYYRVPYDMSVFDKYRSYKAVTLTLIASSTNILLRGLFFTAYLLAISRELDEYQLIYFIMVLKGSQFISGLFSLIIMCIEFWQCTAGSNEWEGATIGLPSACELNGPGVSSPDAHRGLMSSVIGKVLLLLWLQALLFLAFLLLPYAGKYNPKSGKISYERSRRLWKQSEENVKREASMRARWREARLRKQSLAEESKVLRRSRNRAQSTPRVPERDIDLEAGLPVQEMADALSMTPQGFSASPHGRATEQRESTSRPPTSMSEESASPPPMFEHSSSLSGYTFGSMLHSGTYRYDRLIDEEDIDQLIRNGKIGLPPPELLGDDKFSLERAQYEMQNAKRRELAERERKLRKIPLSRTIERTKGFFKSVGRATAHSVTFGKHRSSRGTDKLRFNVTPVEGLMLAIRARGPNADTPRVAGSTPWPFELRGPDEAVKLLSSYVLPRPTSAFTFSSSGSTSTTATKVSGGQITPPHGITIDSAETREAAGIPLEATHFAFAFPLPLAAEALNLAAVMEAEGRPVPAWLNFCLIGGFVYLRMDNDGHCSFLSANALSSANGKEFADGEGMTFVGPLPVSQVSGEALKMSHRMKPLTLNLNGMHMTSFGWVNPGEAPGGIPLDKGPALAFGAFVYATSNGRYYYYCLEQSGDDDEEPKGCWEAFLADRPRFVRRLMQTVNYYYALQRFNYRVLAYPQRAAAAGEGESARLNSLLVYDMKALVVVGLIFVSMVLYAAYVEVLTAQDRAAAVANPDATYATFVAHATHADRHHTPHHSKMSAFQLAAQMESSVETTIGTLGLVVLELFRPSFWNGWRTEISYSICKLIFALTALPFLPLNIGFVNTLFTHAVRTAYNKEGQLTKQDRAGLSAYTRFLRKDVLGNARFDRELREAPFGEDDRRKLAELVEQGEATVNSAWQKRQTMLDVTKKKKLEIMHQVKAMVTQDRATAALYKNFFPNDILIEQLRAKRAAVKQDAEKRAEQQKRWNKEQELRLKASEQNLMTEKKLRSLIR